MKFFTKHILRNLALSVLSAAALSACGGGSSVAPSGGGSSVAPSITISSVPNPVESVMMGNGFQFTATLSGTGSSTVSAEFANPAAGIIASEPSPCALDSLSGVTSCTFTVMTAWDTSLANSLDNLAYQIDISATNSVSVTGSPVSYTELTPTVYLPQTGQTPTAPITATAGMDGYVHAGIPWAYVTSGTTTPATRFTSGLGIESNCVTDNLTGLMWVKVPSSTPSKWRSGSVGSYIYPAQIAVDVYNTNSYCGHSDWYLPTINDLTSLLNDGAINPADWLMYGSGTIGSPACDGACFANVQANYYWSSSTYASDTNTAWLVSFYNGDVGADGKTSGYYVWPVRLAQ